MTIETEKNFKGAEEKTAKKKITRQEQLKMLIRRLADAKIPWFHKALASQPHTARLAFSTLRETGITIERLETTKESVHRIAHEA